MSGSAKINQRLECTDEIESAISFDVGNNSLGTSGLASTDAVFTLTGNDIRLSHTGTDNDSLVTRQYVNSVAAGATEINGLNDASTAGTNNVLLGNASYAVTTAQDSVFLGSTAGDSVTSGNGCTLIGANSGTAIETGTDNVCIGFNSGTTIVGGSGNVCLGENADVDSAAAIGRIAIGNDATATSDNGLFIPTAVAGTTIGAPTSNISRIAIIDTVTGQMNGIADGTSGQVLSTNGSGILSWITGAGGATQIDELTDASTTAGDGSTNIIFGHLGASMAAGATDNLLIGTTAGDAITTGDNNICLGTDAGTLIDTGGNNIIVGGTSGDLITGGNNNIIIGVTAGDTITTGSSNTIIGDSSDVSTSNATGRIAIGANVSATINDGLFLSLIHI